LLPAMVVMATGLAFVFVPITLTAVAGVERTDAGIASALLNVSQQIGGTLGLSALVTVASTAITNSFASQAAALTGPPSQALRAQMTLHAVAHGWATAFLASAAFSAVAVVVAALTIRVEPSDAAVQAFPGGE